MPIKRLTVVAALVSLLLAAGSLQAKVSTVANSPAKASTPVVAKVHTPAKAHTAVKAHTTAKPHAVGKTHNTSKLHAVAKTHPKTRTKSKIKAHAHVARKGHKAHGAAHVSTAAAVQPTDSDTIAAAQPAMASPSVDGELTFNVGPTVSLPTSPETTDPSADNAAKVTELRKALIGLAMDLRDTRYVRGGRDPSTGFDCSGFVRYVFAHAVGMKLPTNSASQFLAGLKVDRADMKPGDLVFFQTGSKHRISHVGIYVANGRFIHSPATGKTVQVSSLSESYWARHFAGAKRPSGIVAAADNG